MSSTATNAQLLEALLNPPRRLSPRSYDESKITRARRAHACQLCCTQIQAGEEQLAYAQGRRSWLYMHVRCAQSSGRYQCKALESVSQL